MTNPTPSAADLNKALFLNLVTMLSMSALQQMGKIINPLTGKTEIQLDAAQATIDMLDMLEVKTRGNRDTDEDKVLKDTLTMLKMNYVETKEVQEPARRSQEPGDGEGGPAVSGQKSEPQKSEIRDQQDDKKTEGHGDKETRGPGEKKDPKFHKSYS